MTYLKCSVVLVLLVLSHSTFAQDNSGRDDSPTNVQPNVAFPPAFQPQIGCAAALVCVEEQFCTSTGVMSRTPVQLTEEQKLRRVPMVDCRNPDNGVIGKCCRDPDYVDPWPAGNLSPEQLKQGFDEKGFPKFLNLTKPKRPFRPAPVPNPTSQFNQVVRPQAPTRVPQQPQNIRPIAPIQPPQTGFHANKIVPETKPFQPQQPTFGSTQLPAFHQKPTESKNPFLQQPKPFQSQQTFQPEQPQTFQPQQPQTFQPQQPQQPQKFQPQQPHSFQPQQPQTFQPQQPQTFQPHQPNPIESAEFPQQAKQPEIIVVPEQPHDNVPEQPHVDIPEQHHVVVPEQPHLIVPEQPHVVVPQQSQVTVTKQPQAFVPQQPSGFQVQQPQQPGFTVTVTEQPHVFHQPKQPQISHQPEHPSFVQPEQPEQPSFVHPEQPKQPSFAHPEQPSYVQPEQPEHPSFVQPEQHEQPSFVRPEQPKQPSFVQPEQPKQPSFAQPEQPSYVQPEQPEQPSYVQPEQPEQPSFAQPEQPSYVQHKQPSFVQPEQPSYVQPEQPSFVQPEQPSYVQPEQPSFVQPEQPSYVQSKQPSYTQPEQPGYEQSAQPQQPSYTQPEQPGYKQSAQPQQPSYTQPEQPGYEQSAQPQQPSYTQPEQPGYEQSAQPQQPQHSNLPTYNQIQGQPKGPLDTLQQNFQNFQQQVANQINNLNPFNKPDSQAINAPADVQDTTTKKPFFSFPNFGFGQKASENQPPVLPTVSIAPHTPGAQCGIINQVQHNYAEGLNDVQTPFGEIPWQAMVLHNAEKKLLCSGAVLAPNVVMTAAHCVYGMNPSEVSIKVGEWKLGYELKHEEPLPFEIAQVQNIETHPGYQPGGPGSDLAMLFLEKPVKLDQHVDTICLSQQPSALERKCISVGWGKTVLQLHAAGALMNKIEVDTLSQDQCRTRLQGAESPLDLDDSLVCVKAHKQSNNLCQVDVGGPLACDRGDGRYELVGVYSQDTGCLPTNQVATFALIDKKWVNDMLNSPTSIVPQLPEASKNYEGPQPGQDRIHYHPQQPGVPCDCQQGTQPAGANAYLPPY